MMNEIDQSIPTSSPFHLANDEAYQLWRERKLAAPPQPDVIHIASAEHPSAETINNLVKSCKTHNFARFTYASPPISPETALQNLGRKLRLDTPDINLCAADNGLTQITVKPTHTDQTYIPYTNRPLGWHTDGYYNTIKQQIYAWLLYCHHPAQQGGENLLLDHHIAYIRLRDQNPDWIRALMHPETFIIPPNIEGGREIRPAHSGPVFSVSQDGEHLHMRYSARQRNIQWRDDPDTRKAAHFMLDLLQNEDEVYKRQIRLKQGEGIVSNNILHSRKGFTDAPNAQAKRRLYRARYYNAIC